MSGEIASACWRSAGEPGAGTPTIVVHRVDLRQQPDGRLLDAGEQTRAARLQVKHARRSFIACRVALRCLLAERLGQAPQDVALALTARGKPQLPGGEWSFNISHSADVALIALAKGDLRLGIDVERVQEHTQVRGMAVRYFHPSEAAAVAGRRPAFFRCWTRKEAVVKAIGTGFATRLDSFAVDVDSEWPAPVRGVGGLTVVPLAVGGGYEAALATDVPAEVVWQSA